MRPQGHGCKWGSAFPSPAVACPPPLSSPLTPWLMLTDFVLVLGELQCIYCKAGGLEAPRPCANLSGEAYPLHV